MQYRVTKIFFPLALIIIFVGNNLFAQNEKSKNDPEREYAADKLLSRSKENADNGAFRTAVLDLIFVLDYYPEYSKIDNVLAELGNDLLEMDMYNAAERIFKYLIKSNLNSLMIPHAIYGLERLCYLQGKYNRAIDYFRILREKYPQVTMDDGIYYYAGQSFFLLDNYDNAILTFNAVENNSEFWGFSLYSRALAKFKKKMLILPLQI